jgi:cytochrome c biogenesis protein CcmG/thiol:disulfide interchange protein DsbE
VQVVIAFMAALAASGSPRPVVGSSAPALDLETLAGRPLPGAQLGGQVTIVAFFATWCQPCHRALADLAAIRSGVVAPTRMIVIAVGEEAETLRRFLAAHPLPAGAELALDVDGAAARRWGQDRFPTTFLVDGSGIIRHINRGWGPGYRERIDRWLREMAPPKPLRQ